MINSKLYAEFINNECPIKNIQTKMSTVSIDPNELLITINDYRVNKNSYVVSPISTYKDYALYETMIVKFKPLRFLLQLLIKIATIPLGFANIDRIVTVNNWLLSTNIYEDISRGNIKTLKDKLLKNYPTHPIMFRSVNGFSNKKLYGYLHEEQFISIPTRQIYIFDGRNGLESEFLTHNNTKKTLKLLKTTSFKIERAKNLSDSDWLRVEDLYNQLYLKKYNELNPHFSSTWLKFAHDHNMIKFNLVYDKEKIIAVSGVYTIANIMTTPIVGYDFSYPKEASLNRILMAIELTHCYENKLIYNASSGASHFKRLRGGEAFIEFSMVLISHLRWYKKSAWHLLAIITKFIGVPVMKIFKL